MHYVSGLWEYKFTSKIITYGQQGVAVFFVISGFVIPYSLWNAGYALRDFFRFLLRRIARIDPCYCVVILICLTYYCDWSNINWKQFAFHFFYLIPFSKYTWYVGVFWTLAIEFQYYLIIGLIFAWLKKGNIYVVCAALMLAACIGYFIPLDKAYSYIIMHLHYFVIGILCFLYKIDRISLRAVHVLLAFILVYLCVRVSNVTGVAGYVPGVLILHANFKTRLTDFFSKISYSLYLIHSFASDIVLKMLGNYHLMNRYFLFLILMLGDIFAAYLLYVVIERPSLKLSKKIKIKSSKQEAQFAVRTIEQ